MKLVECVPNFSEGKDSKVIEVITKSIESVDGAEVRDVDMGSDTNRTVVTIIGTPKAIKEAAFRAIRTAAEHINMAKHSGSHPRMGATDVCPFIPVEGVTMDDCVAIAREVGERVGEELGIPVYLYEEAATSEDRRNLAQVRAGEYEGLADKITDPNWKPDFGPWEWNNKIAGAGATIIGAREFLIAYNINLNTRNAKIAWDIAFDLRDRGRSARTGYPAGHYWKGEILRYGDSRFPCGECDYLSNDFKGARDHTLKEHGYDIIPLLEFYGYDTGNLAGKPVKKPGKFKHCKAIGWYVEDYKCAQVSINLTNYRQTTMHDVFEESKRLAEGLGVSVTGSEVVGLAPYQALLDSGRYYLKRQSQPTGIPNKDIVHTAVKSLGLNDVAPFHLEKSVIGTPLVRSDSFRSMDMSIFIDELSRNSATPGGGSVAAIAGSMGAALASMVCNISTGGRGTEKEDEVLMPIAEKAQVLMDELLQNADEDSRAFDDYMTAKRLPSGNKREVELRKKAMDTGLKNAVEVPLRTARLGLEVIDLSVIAVDNGKTSTASDALVCALMAYSAVLGGIANVKINLGEVNDVAFCQDMLAECGLLEKKAIEGSDHVKDRVDELLR